MFGFFGNHLQPRHPMKRIDYDPAVRIREPAEHPHCWRAGFVSVCLQADSVLGGGRARAERACRHRCEPVLGGCEDGPVSVIRSVFAGFYAGWVWERRVSALRPLLVFVLGWFGLGLVVLGAFVIVLNVLNHTLYGAPVFVQRYLSAIASDNITEAMSTPGVDIDATTLTSRGINGPVSRAM